jgi:hypothetical protein
MTKWFLRSLFPITASSLVMLGVVVHIYPRQEAYEIEFATLSGQTAAIVTASANQIRHIGQRKIPHKRELAHR